MELTPTKWLPEAKDDPYVIEIQGVLYHIPWREMSPGDSVFLPTVEHVRNLASAIKAKARLAGTTARVSQWCNYGVYGVRVWREN